MPIAATNPPTKDPITAGFQPAKPLSPSDEGVCVADIVGAPLELEPVVLVVGDLASVGIADVGVTPPIPE